MLLKFTRVLRNKLDLCVTLNSYMPSYNLKKEMEGNIYDLTVLLAITLT